MKATILGSDWHRPLSDTETQAILEHPAVSLLAYRQAGVISILLGGVFRVEVTTVQAERFESATSSRIYWAVYDPRGGWGHCPCAGWKTASRCWHMTQLKAQAATLFDTPRGRVLPFRQIKKAPEAAPTAPEASTTRNPEATESAPSTLDSTGLRLQKEGRDESGCPAPAPDRPC